MREHKYRAWHKDQQRMFPVFYLSWFNGKLLVGDEQAYKSEMYRSDEVILMDYTGVTDCNGVEICDSDIVHIEHTSLLIPANTIGVVSYTNARYVIDTHAHTHGLNMFVDRRYRRYGKPQIEVVGNVWEHPGLAPKK